MALFTDGPPSAIEDLTAQDSQLLDVAQVERIDLTRKLALAQEETGVEIEALLSKLRNSDTALWTSALPGLPNVIVTPSLKLWHTFRALETVYRDAYHNQLNDRYSAKRNEFRALAKWAYEKLVQGGIGVACEPLSQAATPSVEPAPGGLLDGTYYVTMAWVNAAGEEGACASPAVISVTASTLQVKPEDSPQRASGWNVFLGSAPETMILQNREPLDVDELWVQPDFLTIRGRGPTSGQSPNYMQPVPRLIQRG
jgi:hypothetical protein